MRRVARFLLILSLISLAGVFAPIVQAASPEAWSSRLEAIEDSSLRQSLANSIAAGLITDQADFQTALSRSQARQQTVFFNTGRDTGTTSLAETIRQLAAPIMKLDVDAMKVKKNEGMRNQADRLFQPLTEKVPASYEAAYELVLKFNPKSGTNDAARLDKDIDAYLTSIANDPVIKHALSSTGTGMADLKKNWFSAGLGFEHVIAGELKGGEVSGYHWWYRFYRDEETDSTRYISTLANAGDEHAYTGQFTWDPDGDGPLPRGKKKKGGFSIGNSVQALLALGHIAIESARKTGKIPGAFTFEANINGENFTWQCFTVGGTIRSLYPMGSKETHPTLDDLIREYYDLEEGAAEALNPEGSLTIH